MRIKLPPRNFYANLLKNEELIARNSLDAIHAQERLMQRQIDWTLFVGRYRHRVYLLIRFKQAVRIRIRRWANEKLWPIMTKLKHWADRQISRERDIVDKGSE